MISLVNVGDFRSLVAHNADAGINNGGLATVELSTAEPIAGDGQYVLDDAYGLVWTREFFETRTCLLGGPGFPELASLANHGWLSVPFRKVPRRKVSNAEELRKAIAFFANIGRRRYPGRSIVYRGQVSEFGLQRAEWECARLFGVPQAHIHEPSLLPSDARRSHISSDSMAIWSQLIQLHIASLGRYEAASDPAPYSTWTPAGPAAATLALALGQHYGLPTPALDVTVDPRVAIWFATNALGSRAPGRLVTRSPDVGEGVVYVLAAGPEFFDDSQSPHALRPRRQAGGFLALNWGNAKNRSTRYLVAAIYFDHGAIEEEPDTPNAALLFPGPSDDWLAGLLEQAVAIDNSPPLAELRECVYWVDIGDSLPLEAPLADAPSDIVPAVLNARGVDLAQAGRKREAENYYRRAAELGSPVAAYNLGALLRRRGMLRDAARWLQFALDNGETDAASPLAYVYERMNLIDEAREIWESYGNSYVECAWNYYVHLSSESDQKAAKWLAIAAALGDEDAQRIVSGHD